MLKPRRHVLVEPDLNTYKSYIDPLLEQPDSKYRYVPKLSDLFCTSGASHLPDQVTVTSQAVTKGVINHTLLILANLTGVKAIQPKNGTSIRAMHHYINGMMNQENSFHHYGLVRMLVWVPEKEKAAYMPRTITERKNFTVRLDTVAHVDEIAGADEIENPSHSKRNHHLAIHSEQLTSERAIKCGIWNPEDRRPHPSTPPWHEIGVASDALDQLCRLPNKLSWHADLIELEDAWKIRQGQPPEQDVNARRGRGRPRAEVPKALRVHRARFLTTRKAYLIPKQWAHRQSELDKAEIDLISTDSTSTSYAAKRNAIQERTAKLLAEIAKGRRDLVTVARKYIDDRRGFEQVPPLLQWDRRTAEPLVVRDDEFHPAKKMALLDIKPDPTSLDKLDTFDRRVCFDYLCNMLFRNPAQPIRNDLTTVVQGGLDEFVQKVPELLNPLKGGHPNLDELRARTLPVSLLIQLALALETWPFRMQTHGMIMSTGRRKRNVMLVDE